jgi:hypothetical protein
VQDGQNRLLRPVFKAQSASGAFNNTLALIQKKPRYEDMKTMKILALLTAIGSLSIMASAAEKKVHWRFRGNGKGLLR